MIDKNAVSPVVGVVIMIAATIILAGIMTLFIFSAAHTPHITPSLPYGYVSHCSAVRDIERDGVFLTCRSEGNAFPNWIIYINNTGGPEFTHLIDQSYGGPISNSNHTVFIPCPNPTNIRVYNAQIYGDLPTLAYEAIL